MISNINILVFSVIFGLVVLAVILLIVYSENEDKKSTFLTKWLAVGGFDVQVYRSENGINWSSISSKPFTTPGDNIKAAAHKVAYGLDSDSNVLWNMTGRSTEGTQIFYSSDGENWSAGTGTCFQTKNKLGDGNGIAYGLSSNNTTGLWVATGNIGNTDTDKNRNLLYSLDGKEWTQSTGSSFDGSGEGVAYGLSSNNTTGIWVATGQTTTADKHRNLLYSLDGKDWAQSTGSSFDGAGEGVAYGLSSDNTTGIWVATGHTTTADKNRNLFYSLDGKDWAQSTGSSFNFYAHGVAYGLSSNNTTGIWVAAGIDLEDNSSTGRSLLFSLDGKDWQDCSGVSFKDTYRYDQPARAHNVAYGLSSDKETGIWVAAGNDLRFSLLYSLDGQTWANTTGASFGTGQFANNVLYGLTSDNTTGIWVAVGTGQNDFLYSYDGQTWQRPPTKEFGGGGGGLANDLTNVAFKNTGVSAYLPAIPDVFPNYR